MLLSYKRVLITGGYGFIGSALVRKLLHQTKLKILNIDKIGYASNLSSVNKLIESNNLPIHFIIAGSGPRENEIKEKSSKQKEA